MDPNFHVVSATFNHKFTKFSKIRKITQSPACWIQNLPWKIFIEPGYRDNRRYLSIYVGCAAAITTNPWSCRASVRLYKLDGIKPKIIRTTKFFIFDSEASTSWGHDNFILWDTVVNPANGFIKNDSITIEVSIDAEVPVGIKLTPSYYTDERANIAVKLCDQTISNLQSKIHELEDQNASLQITKRTSTEKIKELKNLLESSEKKYKDENELNNLLKKSIDDHENRLKSEKDNHDNLTKVSDEKITALTEKLKESEEFEKQLTICKSEKRDLELKYSTLSEEFDKYKSTSPNTESELENVPESELVTAKRKYTEIQKQLSLVQKELTEAKAKTIQLDVVLKNNVEKHHQEKVEIESKLTSIYTELSEAKLTIKRMKNVSIKEQQMKEKEKAGLQSQIQSLKSQLYESLVKLNISQNSNENIDKLKLENEKLSKQIESENQKYNQLKEEDAALKDQIETLNKQLLDTNLPPTNTRTIEKEMHDCRDELARCKASNIQLQKSNTNLITKMKETELKMDSMVNSNKSYNEEESPLKAQFEKVMAELKVVKDKKMDETISMLSAAKLDLEMKLNMLEDELKNTKNQLLKSQNDYNKMLVLEKNTPILQTQLEKANNELKRVKAIKLDEFISKLKEEGTNLKKLISTLTPVPEGSDAQIHKTEIESFSEDKTEHKKSNETLQKFQEGTTTNVQTSSSHQDGDDEQIDPNVEMDSMKTTKKTESKPVKKLQFEKPIRSSKHVDSSEKYQRKHPIERRIETLRRQFEKEMRESDNALNYERESLSKKLDTLVNQLWEEKHKLEESNKKQSELKDEIIRLKEENNILEQLKEKFCDQMKTSQNICVGILHLILIILRNLKTSGKLSCSVEALIISNFSTLKQEKLWSLENRDICASIDIHQVIKDISTENLQMKLMQLETHYEESLDIIEKNYELQSNENTYLRTANKELLVVVENEINTNKLYKEMMKIANSRLGDFRKQLTELGNQFMDEKVKRYECEETSKTLRAASDGNEFLLNNIKQKLLKHSIKLSEIEETKLSANSNEDVNLKNHPSSIATSTKNSFQKHSDDSKDLKKNINNSVPVRIESQETKTQPVVNKMGKFERSDGGMGKDVDGSQTDPTQETSILGDSKSPSGSSDDSMASVGLESSTFNPEMGS